MKNIGMYAFLILVTFISVFPLYWMVSASTNKGFWGLMKREMYYGKKYKTKEELMLAIEKYIDYYTNKRVQRNLGVLTPLEFHEQKLESVA